MRTRPRWRRSCNTRNGTFPIVYADGLDDFLKVESLPTVVVLDRDGKIVYRVGGLDLREFSSSLNTALQNALASH